MAETTDKGASTDSGAPFIPANAAAAAKPVIEAGQAAISQVSVRAERYFEQWVDLVEEVRAEQVVAGQPVVSLDDALAGLAAAEVMSVSTGRVRLRLPELHGQRVVAEELADVLVTVPGIKRVQVSAITGSVLIFYSERDYPAVDDLLEAIAT